MIKRIKSKNIITPEGITDGYVYIDGEKISYVGKEERPFDFQLDAGEDYVSPGFIDIHTHGACGVDYCSPDNADDVVKALEYQAKHGATTVYPTLTSNPFEVTMAALSVMRKALCQKLPANVPGVHMEGPFFSVKQNGGQKLAYLMAPTPDYYMPVYENYGDIIARWDLAPELDENLEFARFLKKKGIKAAIAHSDAAYEHITAAMEEDVNLVTHLYSCTSTITRRSGFRVLGVTECAYLFDELWCEIICDGKHLPPPLLKLIFKNKPHDKLILVTDSICVAGIGGEGTLTKVGDVDGIIEEGVCKLLDRSAFGGSIATMDMLIKVVTEEAGLPLLSAVKMASENPARYFGLNKGALEAGKDADIVIFDKDINVKRTVVMGNLYG